MFSELNKSNKHQGRAKVLKNHYESTEGNQISATNHLGTGDSSSLTDTSSIPLGDTKKLTLDKVGILIKHPVASQQSDILFHRGVQSNTLIII